MESNLFYRPWRIIPPRNMCSRMPATSCSICQQKVVLMYQQIPSSHGYLESSKRAMINYGAVVSVTDCLSRFPRMTSTPWFALSNWYNADEEVVQQYACKVLANICSSCWIFQCCFSNLPTANAKSHALQLQAIDLILSTIHRFPHNPQVHEACCSALLQLADEGGEYGGTTVFYSSIRAFASSSQRIIGHLISSCLIE